MGGRIEAGSIEGKTPGRSSLCRRHREVAARSADGGAMAQRRGPSTIMRIVSLPMPFGHRENRLTASCYPSPVRRAKKRSEEPTSELQSLMRISYAVFCLKQNNINLTTYTTPLQQN